MMKMNVIKLTTFFCSLICASSSLDARACYNIPGDLFNEFTLNGQIPVSYDVQDGSGELPNVFTTELIDENIEKALVHFNECFGESNNHLYDVLDRFGTSIRGKRVALIGTYRAWFEGILLSYRAIPVVITSHPTFCDDPRITYLSPEEYAQNPEKFDLVINMATTPHQGLGRYGDELDPNGDLKAMEEFRKMLTPEGHLVLALPVGPDQLVWNSHRVYGEKRLKMIMKGWRVVAYYGFTSEYLYNGVDYWPVFLLKSKI